MNFNSVRFGFVTITFGIAANGMIATGVHADEFSFTATNTTNSAITQVLVSKNKKDWGYVDIRTGIKPESTVRSLPSLDGSNEISGPSKTE